VDSANFAYSASESGSTCECSLDSTTMFESCDPAGKSYTDLSEGPHTFRVRATKNGLTGSTASRSWTVDTVPPDTSILTMPADPSDGTAPFFTFSSTEAGSTFKCKLDDGPEEACSSAGKTYPNQTDGEHTFTVYATDPAGNPDSTPAEYTWTVDTVLEDVTPPVTSILSAPAAFSANSNASFTYGSNEPGSTFECKLDGAALAACPPNGPSYVNLKNGSHTFQVRARDVSGNVDATPETHQWTIAAPVPNTTATCPAKRTAKKKSARVVCSFASSKGGSSFRCKLDGQAFVPCTSPRAMTMKVGRHTFSVFAIDSAGNADASPATRSTVVKKKKKKKKKKRKKRKRSR